MAHFEFGTASHALPGLARYVMDDGEEVGSRVGRVKELRHVSITLNKPTNREIITKNRHASLPAQIAETAWVLAGRDDIGWLSHYLPRAPEFSDNGFTWRGAYGPRIRSWHHDQDQLDYVVSLLREDPLSRRAVIQIYDPETDMMPGKDIPCNQQLHFSSRLGYLDLHVITRSNDLIWGWSGINAFEWSVLQEIVASMLGVYVGKLHFSITSLHIYDRHWDKADSFEFVEKSPNPSPRFNSTGMDDVSSLDYMLDQWFTIEEKIRTLGAPFAWDEINNFPEPMFQSWLRVLAYHWSQDENWLRPLSGTRLQAAALESPKHRIPEDTRKALRKEGWTSPREFNEFVSNLHSEKHAAYGDSWKKRGEMLSILANIARKVDRLSTGVETSDETSADTAIDLLVYLIKYRWWLSRSTEGPRAPSPVNVVPNSEEGKVSSSLEEMGHPSTRQVDLVGLLKENFEYLTRMVEDKRQDRWMLVDDMIDDAYDLAYARWSDTDEYRGADAD